VPSAQNSQTRLEILKFSSPGTGNGFLQRQMAIRLCPFWAEERKKQMNQISDTGHPALNMEEIVRSKE
jgi:hypothetical protein